MTATTDRRGRVKCVVWDLDNTLWDGVLLEGDATTPRPYILEAIRTLDARGILNSIASRNEEAPTVARLRELGIEELFLHPRIGWQDKSESIRQIAAALNLSVDAFAFVDDQPYELAEVAHALPGVIGLDPGDVPAALDRPEFKPRFVTDESRRRRDMYRGQIARDDLERTFQGANIEFLRELGMRFTIRPASRTDLQRAEELTVRTNQLNSTGRTYSFDELAYLLDDDDHLVLVADLTDRFGSYGTIGLALVERGQPFWWLRLLLMSCRVMSRGVGTILLNHVASLAAAALAPLRADFVATGRNRMMRVTYAFAGFTVVSEDGPRSVLESDPSNIQTPAEYICVTVESTTLGTESR